MNDNKKIWLSIFVISAIAFAIVAAMILHNNSVRAAQAITNPTVTEESSNIDLSPKETNFSVYTVDAERSKVLYEEYEAEQEAKKKAEEESRAKAEAEAKAKAEAEAKAKADAKAAAQSSASQISVPATSGGKAMSVPNVPQDFKTYTNYVKSVSRSSRQWKILTADGTWTDENGFRRAADDSYMVAMGSYYVDHLGEKFKITTATGNVFYATICDLKADCHTDAKNQYTMGSYCICEFYVDSTLNSRVSYMGTCSVIPDLAGRIVGVEKLS